MILFIAVLIQNWINVVAYYKYIMKALILVGGYGTRMRPLTINYPKSAFPFANKPMVEHQIEALAKIGVVQVVIAINYQAHFIKSSLEPLEAKYNIKITYSQEEQALGTAGPLKLAEHILKKDNDLGLFFVFNSDIICDYPLEELKKFHEKNGGEGSILLASVQDPSRFGVVVANPSGKVQSFVEKPNYFISNKINAGVYLLNVSVIDRIPQRFCMIEKEIFPAMAQEGKLFSLPLQNDFWFDIGKPGDYILGQAAYLNYYKIKSSNEYIGNVLVDSSSVIQQGCKIGPNVVIGPNCTIKRGTRLKDCTIVGRTVIGSNSFIDKSIISWKCKIGDWVRIEGLTCLAQEVEVKSQLRITECMVLSHKAISTSVSKEILM